MYSELCTLDRLGAVKLELISLALSKASTKNELRENLILVNKLIKRAKEDQNSVDISEIKSIENYAKDAKKGR